MGGIFMPYMTGAGQQGYVTPSQIPNLNLWYNGSASTTTVNNVVTNNFDVTVSNGTAIGSWIDLQGVGGPSNYYNGGGGNKPTYAIPIQNGLGSVLYASATKENLDINPVGSWLKNQTGLTVYTVARPTSLPGTLFPLVVADTSLGMWWNGTNWSVGTSATNYGTSTVTNDTTKFHMYGLIFDGSQATAATKLKFRYDKTAATVSYTGAGNTTTGSPGAVFFGGDARASGTFSQTFMNGYIGEVLIWTRTLSAIEQSQVEYYLNQKWALGL